MNWQVDLHSHTLWSKDCVTRFDSIVSLCRRRGLNRIAITDHNTAEGAKQLQQKAPELIIVGEEIMTTQGELLAYFVKETVPEGLTPDETIDRLRQQGAVISVSHPFDRLRKGAWYEEDLLKILNRVDAIEVFNSRCLFMEDNVRALRFAQEHNLIGTAGSDAHTWTEYGKARTVMRPFAPDPEDFLDALREADFVRHLSAAYVHLFSKTAKWSKKLGFRARQWEGG
ncbi:MAG: PHP domain-containing protein [bacterium]|nr:PHP domain-containing protein [bacterium]